MKSEGPQTASICILQCGNEILQLMSKLLQFTGVHFPDLNPNSYDNLNNLKLKVSTKQVQI